MFESQKPETRQVWKRLASIPEQMQVQTLDMTRFSKDKSSSVGKPHLLQIFYGNFSQLSKKNQIGIMVQFGNKFMK